MTNTPANVAEHLIQAANTKLTEAVKRNFAEPKEHLQSFMDRYDYIVNGKASQEIDTFMKEQHTFEEYIEVSSW